ncbi:MAG: hypothetical protein DI539_19085 [Flavobacterium psychrophilum]|nr:MAG: hypothetical protein DI539_19085 [Flavobacterium psychrophilum]
MLKKILACVFILAGFLNVSAQNITAKIIDSVTSESLSHASIVINDTENLVSNADGYFTIADKYTDDALMNISFLGYKSMLLTLGELKKNNLTVRLQPGIFELETVYVSNTKINADSIMASVKRNLSKNYKFASKPNEKKIFYREGLAFKPIKLKAEMTGAEGYTKKQINEANTELKAFTAQLVSHPPQEFMDMLTNYYTGTKIYKEKPIPATKFEVIKAVQLKDKSRAIDLNDMEKMASGILFRHLDNNKYYRIKSGLLGTRDTVVANGAFYESKKYQIDKNKVNIASRKVSSFISTSTLQSYKLDFVIKQELYEYSYAGTTQATNNESVFIIKFRPKKRKGKYAGTLFISEKDYAVLRTDYTLGEGKTLSGVNLKFLFGVKQSENVSKGTLIFKEAKTGEGYRLQYSSIEEGQYVYVNRPLKFLEIADDDKHYVAFDLKVEANIAEKKECFIISDSEISQSDFDNIKYKEFDYIEIDHYNPDIWKEYSILEPLEEMKNFKTIE